jgi:predicted ATP-grasp superfamily ATP-dependent carboligase
MRRVFVYEYLSGGGSLGGDAEAEGLLAMGAAMRDAIVSDLRALPELSVTCAVSARRGAGAPHAAMATATARAGEDPVAFVQRLAAEHDLAWVVAPETDGLLLDFAQAVDPPRWIGCRPDAIRVAGSKRATLEALHARGVPTPLSFGPRLTRRWIVKPDDGAGAVATRVHADQAPAQADLQRRQQAGQSADARALRRRGRAVGVDAGRAGSVQAIAFNRQDIRIQVDGTVAFVGVQHNAIDVVHDSGALQLHHWPRRSPTRCRGCAVRRLRPGLAPGTRAGRDRGQPACDHRLRRPVAALGRNLAAQVIALHDKPEPVHAAA